MDAANRWETEAMRESRDRRSRRPAVSQDRDASSPGDDWRTLRDASDLTGIPIGTLRKWCRRATVDSYLESDGELTLRMVEMGSVRARSTALHGKEAKRATSTDQVASRQSPDASQEEGDASSELRAASTEEVAGRQTPDARPDQVASRQSPVASQEEVAGRQTPVARPDQVASRQSPDASTKDEDVGDVAMERETMIVPVDAWNKMLNQLGNLHEAGQQLAEARERAAKAETESLFLRERLAEMREEVAGRQTPDASPEAGDASSELRAASREDVAGRQSPVASSEEVASRQSPVASPEEDSAPNEGVGDPAAVESAETVSFWRYVARGWKGRRR